MQRLSHVPTFSFSLHVWTVVSEVSVAACVSLWWLQLKTRLVSHWERAVGRPTKENHIVSSNGGREPTEFCPYSGKARPSSDQSSILSKGSFILSQGYVVKNISNDDSNTQWVKMLKRSFISCEMSWRDLFFDPQGQRCLLEPEDSFDIAQRLS